MGDGEGVSSSWSSSSRELMVGMATTFWLAGGAARAGRLKLVGVTSWSSKFEFESGGGKAAG